MRSLPFTQRLSRGKHSVRPKAKMNKWTRLSPPALGPETALQIVTHMRMSGLAPLDRYRAVTGCVFPPALHSHAFRAALNIRGSTAGATTVTLMTGLRAAGTTTAATVIAAAPATAWLAAAGAAESAARAAET